MAENERPPASSFIDAEAEESGAEGRDDEQEDEDVNDTGEDLQGFIAPDEEVEAEAAAVSAAAARDAAAASSSDEEEGELGEEDFEVLREAGLDISQIGRKRPKSPGPGVAGDADGQKRPRTSELVAQQERDLFGDEPVSGLVKELAPLMDDGGLSEGESIQSFMVDDDPAAKRHKGATEAQELGITEDQLQQVKDIFGDASVLQPIDELDFGVDDEPSVPASIVASLGAAEAAATVATASAEPKEEELDGQLVPKEPHVKAETAELALVAQADIDPGLVEKSYQLPRDIQMENTDVPERWYQAYQGHATLVDEQGLRSWTDEETATEARWIYSETFRKLDGYDRIRTEDAISRVLILLHERRLEPVYICHQMHWQFAKVLSQEDVWKVYDQDFAWQPIWARFLRLREWVEIASRNAQIPEYIKQGVDQTVWNSQFVESRHKDVQDWLSVYHPDSAPPTRQQQSSSVSKRETLAETRIKAARAAKFDEKLGIQESIEVMSLRAFGITPAEMGENIREGKQMHKPNEDLDFNEDNTPKTVCGACIDHTFGTWEAVLEAVMYYLSRLIAAEPHVREYVREEFWSRCAISTHVTDAGRKVAKDAGHSLKQSYRACHVVNRPVAKFEEDDELFMDILALQRQGFINMEYSLVEPDPTEKMPLRYKLVMLGCNHDDMVRQKTLMGEFFQKDDLAKEGGGVYEPQGQDEIASWKWCHDIIKKLQDILRSKEAERRRNTHRAKEAELKDVYKESFRCSTMTFGRESLIEIMSLDPIFDHLTKHYCLTQERGDALVLVPDVDNPWNRVRKQIIKRALADELYPMLWAEVQDSLVNKVESLVCKKIRTTLKGILDVKPHWPSEEDLQYGEIEVQKILHGDDAVDDLPASKKKVDPAWELEKEGRKQGLTSAMVIVPEVGADTVVVGFINMFGDPIDMRQLFRKFFDRPPPFEREAGSFMWLKEKKIAEHRQNFKEMLTTYKPSVVLIAINDPEAVGMKRDVEEMLKTKELAASFKVLPHVMYANIDVPRSVAYSQRVMESDAYRDYAESAHRIAISLARFHQDPFAEAAQLWHELPEENGLFTLKLHRLQGYVRKDRLNREFVRTLMEVVSNVGLHFNKVRRSGHLRSSIAFIPGIGPRKARLFEKCLGEAISTRKDMIALMAQHMNIRDPLHSPVVTNVLPFVRICPDFRDNWSANDTPGIDRTRLGRQLQEHVINFCQELLEAPNPQEQEEDEDSVPAGDVVARTLRIMQRNPDFESTIQERDWSNWAGKLENLAACADIDQLFELILDELRDPYMDMRQHLQEFSESDLFYFAYADSSQDLSAGCLVQATVIEDSMHVDAKAKNIERDDGQEKEPRVRVVVVPCGANGIFNKAYKVGDAKGFIAGCERIFQRGEGIVARLESIRGGRGKFMLSLSVDMTDERWYSLHPITGNDAFYFVPLAHEDFTKVKLGIADMTEQQKKQKLKEWVRRPRNIRHPNFTSVPHEQAVAKLESVAVGGCVFRSSRHYDVLVGLLKVRPTSKAEADVSDNSDMVAVQDCYRTFEVMEHMGERTFSHGFEIAHELEVDGEIYRDLDEIIARHFEPISDNLRLLQEHKRFGLKEGQYRDKEEVKAAMRKFSTGNKMLHYCFILNDEHPGHALLLWCVAGKPCREEFIEVTPFGFNLWCQKFSALGELINWFKSVGWRNASSCRKDFKEAWARRQKELKDKRGENADPNPDALRITSFDAPTLHGDLQAAGTPNVHYVPEGAAATPSGFRTPTSAPMSVLPPMHASPSTPWMAGQQGGAMGRMAPATPFELRGGHAAPCTAQMGGCAAPSTPAAAFANRATPTNAVPRTPAGLFSAMTPARGTPGGMIPSTPAGAMAPGTPAAAFTQGLPARGTPGSIVPMTPAGAGASAPGTPAAAFSQGLPARGTPGGIIPSTPAGPFQPGTPAGFASVMPAFLTPPGFIPATPAGSFQPGLPARGTPGGVVPMTPAAAAMPYTPRGPAMSGTPGGIVPQTPAGNFAPPQTPGGAAPMTPRAAFGQVPSTPAR
eukprot:TRINITY_DN23440_c0_g1_i1.p1 TRINITY_DN23440_c0_g1~~TRINITY_DN23440_c0_g1_i1.p1  ORF type:complete len:2025 (+),score=362.66 TRINITY_DN23440_c0_g1_i1:63-6137(+)